MVHTAVRKNTLLEDFDILFLILTKPACDRSLVPSIDPLVYEMDVTTTFIAWSTMTSLRSVKGHGIPTF